MYICLYTYYTHIRLFYVYTNAHMMAQQVKNTPAVQKIQETQVYSLDLEQPLEKDLRYSCLKNRLGSRT